jgi:SAM-dependent methyltransferase
MFSYIFMKILESRPSRYDKGINILTGGHAKRVKRKIVDRWIKPGLEILDIGCGTGELLELATRAGARVSGIDISEGMLSIAQNRSLHPVPYMHKCVSQGRIRFHRWRKGRKTLSPGCLLHMWCMRLPMPGGGFENPIIRWRA